MTRELCALTLTTLLVGLAACSTLQQPATLDPDLLATSVSATLTAVPPRTLPPEPTDTEPAVLPTEPPPEPSATEPPSTAPLPPEASATPTAVPTNTPTAGPTGTLPAGDIRNTLGDPTWRDTLSSGNNWPLGEGLYTRASVEEGELQLTGLSTIDGWRLSWPVVTDFYLEMTVRTGSCTGSDRYGLMARVPDRTAANRGYLFGFTCNGRYSLRAWDGPSETMTQLIPLTSSAAIVSGSQQVNRIGLWAKGEQLAMYANGTLLAQFQDDTYTDEGSFGIFVGARETENFTIHVDEIAYWGNP